MDGRSGHHERPSVPGDQQGLAASGLCSIGPRDGRILPTCGGSDSQVGSSEKERPMGSKRPARREFLKSGAALAGGFTLGAAAPAIGQTPSSPPMIKGDKDQIAYGDRSRFVTSVRIPHRPTPPPPAFPPPLHLPAP